MIVLALIGLATIIAVVAGIVGLSMSVLNNAQKRPCESMSDRFLQRNMRETEQRIYKNIFMPIVEELWYVILIILLVIVVGIAKAIGA